MTEKTVPLDRIESLYSSNLSENGLASTAVGWNSLESQILRFEKLTSVIEDRSSAVSVNDYGCGYGAHLEYLAKDCGIFVDEYFGYDLSVDMLAAAERNLSWFSGQKTFLRSSDVTTMADYTFVSGTFNVRFDADDSTWSTFIQNKLDQIDRFSRRGFAFNLLSTYVDWQNEHLFYGDPGYWFDVCKRRYSRKVALLHDYPLYEWTIVVKK